MNEPSLLGYPRMLLLTYQGFHRLTPDGDLDMTLLMLRVATLEAKMSQMVGE